MLWTIELQPEFRADMLKYYGIRAANLDEFDCDEWWELAQSLPYYQDSAVFAAGQLMQKKQDQHDPVKNLNKNVEMNEISVEEALKIAS